MVAKMKVRRKGRIPTKYTLHPREMMKIGAIVEADIQEKVRASRTPTGGNQTPNQPATVRAKGHSVPLISGSTEKHRFVDAKWDKHPGFGVVKLSLPKHGIQPSAWDVMGWLTKPGKVGKTSKRSLFGLGKAKGRKAYKPIMSISKDASREILDFVVFTTRKMIAKQARAARSGGR